MTATQRSLLARTATRFLYQHGYRWDGRPKGEVKGEQSAFERKMRPNPFRGRSTRKR